MIDLQRFFEDVRRGVLTAVRCQHCGEVAMPPQECCRSCRERTWVTIPLRGDGTITSFSVRDGQAGGSPDGRSAVALVRLEEGVSIVARVTDIPVEQLRIGMAVRFRPLMEGNETTIGFGPAHDA